MPPGNLAGTTGCGIHSIEMSTILSRFRSDAKIRSNSLHPSRHPPQSSAKMNWMDEHYYEQKAIKSRQLIITEQKGKAP